MKISGGINVVGNPIFSYYISPNVHARSFMLNGAPSEPVKAEVNAQSGRYVNTFLLRRFVRPKRSHKFHRRSYKIGTSYT